METIRIQKVSEELKDYFSNYNLNTCFTCGTCSGGCPATGTPELEGLDVRKILRMLVFGMVEEVVSSDFPWLCTGCGRCVHACPMGVDIVYLMKKMKSLRPRDQVPGIVHKGVEAVLATGNNMSIPKADYFYLMADLGQEMAKEVCSGFYAPIDRKGADVFFWPNSKEVFADDDDMKWWWKIFYAARENWTSPSENWEAVDWGLFTGNDEATKTLARRKIDFVKQKDVKRMIMPDCGGGSFGCRVGMKACKEEDPSAQVEFVYLYEYLIELIKSREKERATPSGRPLVLIIWQRSGKCTEISVVAWSK